MFWIILSLLMMWTAVFCLLHLNNNLDSLPSWLWFALGGPFLWIGAVTFGIRLYYTEIRK